MSRIRRWEVRTLTQIGYRCCSGFDRVYVVTSCWLEKWEASCQGRPPNALGGLGGLDGDLDGQVGTRPTQSANSATPWRTVKCFADNNLTDLSAKPPRVTTLGKKCRCRGFYSHQSAIHFGKLALVGRAEFVSSAQIRRTRSGCAMRRWEARVWAVGMRRKEKIDRPAV